MKSPATKYLSLIVFIVGANTFCANAGLVYYPGTGHWYEAVQVPAGLTWNEANNNAIIRGGHLCTITSSNENTFVAALTDASYYSGSSVYGDILGPWLGGLRHANEGIWRWVTGESFTFSKWYPNQPDGYGGSEQRLEFYAGVGTGSTWGDHPGDPIAGFLLPRGYVVEYDGPILSLTTSNNLLAISWPQPAEGWILETTPALSGVSLDWSQVSTNEYQTNLTSVFATITNRTGNAFYRLKRGIDK